MIRRKNNAKNAATHSRKTELLDSSQPFAYVEAYKAMRTNFDFATLDGELKSIVVTSCVPTEGKTTFSINLAISLAEAGRRVLLVDADLRNPSVQRYLRLRHQETLGLSNVLSSKVRAADALGHFERYGFDIILSGAIPPNPVELLDSKRVKDMIDEVKDDYDHIIFDTPPSSFVTDATVLSKSVDGIIMVVGQGVATQEQIKKSKLRLHQSGTKIIGAVLNLYEARKDRRNTSGDEDYYYYAHRDGK